MRTLIFLLLLSACGGAAGTPAITGTDKFSGNASTTNTHSPSVATYNNCTGNSRTGVWQNNADPSDQLTFGTDCNIVSNQCGVIMNAVPDAFTYTSGSFTSWVYNYGSNISSCYDQSGSYMVDTRTINYHFFSSLTMSVAWRTGSALVYYTKVQ